MRTYWDPALRLFVDNRPALAGDGTPRTHDRTLATAVVHGLVPDGDCSAMAAELAAMPARCGRSYPANAAWRLEALARLGREDVVVAELRSRWAALPSVVLNNALQENWEAKPDSTEEWSHCPVGFCNVLIQDLVGLRPLEPGFARWRLRPRLCDLGDLALDAHTVGGAFRIRTRRDGGRQRLSVEAPAGAGPGTIELPDGSVVAVRPGTTVAAG